MQLTSFTDYALRALMRLAADPGRTFTTQEIASEFGISRDHLTKVVQGLASEGYVVTRRGAGGGFRLSRSPEAITIGDVVRSLEARYPMVECFRSDGGSCVLTSRCRLKGQLVAAREAFLRTLEATSLAQCAYPASRKEVGRLVKS